MQHVLKIVFITGSLQPGCDGVGDYTRLLAGELIRRGSRVGIIALNDFFIKEELNSVQLCGLLEIPLLRLPSFLTMKERFKKAKTWIDDFDPEWLSLQYVPFSYHSKGLPFGLSRKLVWLGKGKRWHVMFHELWVGMNVRASTKEILWGKLQRVIICSLVTHLKPSIIHTHSQLYQKQLMNCRIDASLLPLFTNIPPTDALPEQLIGMLKKEKPNTWVLFGTIHPGAPVEFFANEVSELVREGMVLSSLTIVGRCGTEQEYWAHVWKDAGLVINILGEQSSEQISLIMSRASLGIVTTPAALAEKSGAVAAMLSHNLPVLCVSKFWKPPVHLLVEPPSGVMEYIPGNLKACLQKRQIIDSSNTVANVSRQFVDSILGTF
ncbi:hypothetical protein ACFS7Z_20515 [Pontibacter toksunensis]|uniref:Glycosyltransferase involved in cell wall biosynthesis n=1 Tax=Pontibacter toksunensis TaxID=1332631 RepID=A0ABW6C0R8_9BACT